MYNRSVIPLTRGVFALLLPIVALFAQDPGVTPTECPTPMASIADCPDTGCGGVSDAFLNQAKNRTDELPPGDLVDLSVARLRQIPQPSSWKTGKDRDLITGPGREGTPVRLTGFLQNVRRQGAESCNCDLTGGVDTDIHLVIVQKLSDDEKKSVTAEITPRVRAQGHPDWSVGKVNDFTGKLVRLTGWLMLDTAHFRHPVLLPGEAPHFPLKRATNWEVHPVLKFEFCNESITKCKAGQGWQSF
jgi:hypothetical protein